MQLPFLYHVAAEAGRAARRFPLTLLCAIVLCVAGCRALAYVNGQAQQTDWLLPQGWVSMMILALVVAGVFALLLIHPRRNNAENTWIRTFARWFHRALFPLPGLLAVAIGTRIRAYGITEERYFVLLLAAWPLGLASYFVVRRGQGIVWMPVSLAALAFLSATGPWGAFAVAERSQLAQLRELTERYKLLQNGRPDGANGRAPNLPAPVELRAHAGRLHLRLFLSSLNRDGTGLDTRDAYSAQGELGIEPQ